MVSSNFEFLRSQQPELADQAAFAERYIWSDPTGAAGKLRNFAELLTRAIYQRSRLPPPPSTEFAALLTAPAFTARIPEGVRNILHGIRKGGNEAAHGGTVSSKLALDLSQGLLARGIVSVEAVVQKQDAPFTPLFCVRAFQYAAAPSARNPH